MDKDKGPLSKLKKLLREKGILHEKSGKIQYLLIVLVFGAAIMLLGNFLFKDVNTDSVVPVLGKNEGKEDSVETLGKNKSEENDLIRDYENYYETQLKEALEQIVGVSDVTVVVNVDATEKRILEKNKTNRSQETNELDQEGGKRKVHDQSEEEQLVIIREGDKEVPIVLETKKPKIRGVLVVANGADNVQVEKWIVESVTKLLDVPSHRVSVMPRK